MIVNIIITNFQGSWYRRWQSEKKNFRDILTIITIIIIIVPGAWHRRWQLEKEIHSRHSHRLKVFSGGHQRECQLFSSQSQTFQTFLTDLLISVLQSWVFWKLVCFRLLWKISWREQRLCRSSSHIIELLLSKNHLGSSRNHLGLSKNHLGQLTLSARIQSQARRKWHSPSAQQTDHPFTIIIASNCAISDDPSTPMCNINCDQHWLQNEEIKLCDELQNWLKSDDRRQCVMFDHRKEERHVIEITEK